MCLSVLHSVAQKFVQFEFTARGCCLMCENRILEAIDVRGVRAAEWDRNSEKATVVYRVKKISEESIQKLVADVGHDTDLFVASDDVYDKLNSCCLYRSGCGGCSDGDGSIRESDD